MPLFISGGLGLVILVVVLLKSSDLGLGLVTLVLVLRIWFCLHHCIKHLIARYSFSAVLHVDNRTEISVRENLTSVHEHAANTILQFPLLPISDNNLSVETVQSTPTYGLLLLCTRR